MHGDFLDEIDIKLLEILQQEGRKKRGDLAEHVGLSIPAVSERMNKMEEHGYITGYHAVLDKHKIGLEVTAYIFLISESSVHYTEVTEIAAQRKEVLECHAITGSGSHLLKVRVKNMIHLEQLLGEIQSWPGVKSTNTDIVLSTAKETQQMPLKHLRSESS